MNIVDLDEARTFALTLTRANRSAAGLLIEELADEVESLEREVARLRAELIEVKARARSWKPPVHERQERAAKLRADAEYWAGVAAEEIDGEKQAMAEALARSLSEQAEEVDL